MTLNFRLAPTSQAMGLQVGATIPSLCAAGDKNKTKQAFLHPRQILYQLYMFFGGHSLFHMSTFRLLPGDWGASLGQLSMGLGPSEKPAMWRVAVMSIPGQSGG